MADEEKASGAEIRKRYRFLLSSFTQEERQELANSIFKLGGSYSESSVRETLFSYYFLCFTPPTRHRHQDSVACFTTQKSKEMAGLN